MPSILLLALAPTCLVVLIVLIVAVRPSATKPIVEVLAALPPVLNALIGRRRSERDKINTA